MNGRRVFSNFRRTVSDRRKMFVAVIILAIVTIAIVETVTIGATRRQLIRRTDSSLRNKVETARITTSVLTPAALGSLLPLSRVLEQDSALAVIDAGGRVVYQLPVRLSGGRSAIPTIRFES